MAQRNRAIVPLIILMLLAAVVAGPVLLLRLVDSRISPATKPRIASIAGWGALALLPVGVWRLMRRASRRSSDGPDDDPSS